ncbi:MAG: helix-turn-helix transcriptional regulator [Polyangiaceae bacterium]|nr:helix-turn-helix transcriptional regulator [Polyangiaceae bacterium]NUQ77973.1 helix-turn-helix transcriptional regulator [Polyangiaceae bacterium]
MNAIASQLNDFGREVRRRRQALGITLEDLARASGLTPNYLGSIELGKRDPSLSTLEAIAKGLRVPVGELLGGTRELSPSSLEAAILYDGAPPEVRSAVTEILHAVTRKKR